MKELRDTIYEVWDEEDESNRGKTEEYNFGLKDQNIWGHTHRMYLLGFNSIRYPWQIPKDFPRDALKKQDREKLLKFIDEYNDLLKFTFCEKLIVVFFKIFYPPFTKTVHLAIRKKKFRFL